MSLLSIKEVAATGDPSAKMALIGEAPSNWELFENRPFVERSPAGSVLEMCLHGARLIRSELYITNLFKFKVSKVSTPVRTKILHGTTKELLWDSKTGFTAAGMLSVESLKEELEGIQSNVFVPLGGPALEALTQKKGITKWRGSILSSTLVPNRKVIPTLHPAMTLYGGDYLGRYNIIHDLALAKDEMQFPEIRIPAQEFLINPSVEQTLSFLQTIYFKAQQGKIINFDIETINSTISLISFAYHIGYGIAIPFDRRWTLEEETKVWKAIAKVLELPSIKIANQNIMFDILNMLFFNRILVSGTWHDPMVAHSIIYPDFPKGLDFLTSIYTKIPYYKETGKQWFKGQGDKSKIDEFYTYSAQDSMVSIECLHKLMGELSETSHTPTYERTIRLMRPIAAMAIRGLRIDKDSLLKLKTELETRRDAMQTELNTLTKREFNVKSSTQKHTFFAEELGIKPYLKNSRPTYDETAMIRLAKGTSTRPPIYEAKLMLEITKIRSMLEKYMDIQFDPDGRLRHLPNVRGTTTGRISTGKNIATQTGANIQNLTEEFGQFVIADEGYCFCEVDKSQAEWVVVAYYGGDARMIEVIEKGIDPHARTGSLITGITDIDLIKAEAKALGHETNPKVLLERREKEFPEIMSHIQRGGYVPRTMTIRQCGKKTNHGGNYGVGYKRCALIWEIPENEARVILDLYHKGYPGIRNGFQASIQDELSRSRTITNCFGVRRRFFGRWGEKMFEQAYGYLPQSTVAYLINDALISLYEDTSPPMDKVELLKHGHDSILYQFPVKTSGVLDFAKTVKKTLIAMYPTMQYFGREFTIQSDVKVGYSLKNMIELKGISHETPIERLAERISQVL